MDKLLINNKELMDFSFFSLLFFKVRCLTDEL